MADKEPQTYENHRRYVPLYHGYVFVVFGINFFYQGYRCFRDFSFGSVLALLMGFAFLVVFLYGRGFPLKAQDRVIRLEEQLRLHKLLPESQRGRVDDFHFSQLVALRFASDAELPELAIKVLDDDLRDREAVKKLIKDWRADNFRV